MKKLFIIIGFLCVMATVSFGEERVPISFSCACPPGYINMSGSDNECDCVQKVTCPTGSTYDETHNTCIVHIDKVIGDNCASTCGPGYWIDEQGSCHCASEIETATHFPELNLKDFEVTKLDADDGSFIIELTRNSGSYIYTLVLEMDDNQHPTVIRRYCKGNAFCNTLSQGVKCEESNWSDWCYKEE